MEEKRVRIADIAEELGLSTATVSNVIHGKTSKISEATVAKVQEVLEKRGYIPSMAGILLAQNNSRIIGIAVNNHPKYEGRVLEDGFISSAVNALSKEIDQIGHFMMIKVTAKWEEIVRFASMWNMDGLILIGFCEQDYKKLRDSMHIPLVAYDGYAQEAERSCNLTIDDFDGGRQVGAYLKRMEHRKILCIADNAICMDAARIKGVQAAMGESPVDFLEIPMQKEERLSFYREREAEILEHTAVFAVSDFYAVELLHYLQTRNIRVPEDISVVGFDDSPLCSYCFPALTTVRQDADARAKSAVLALQKLRDGATDHMTVKLPVYLIERDSVKELKQQAREEGDLNKHSKAK